MNQTKCIDKDSCSLGFVVIEDTCQKCHNDCKECGQPGETALSDTHSHVFCTKCSDSEKLLHDGLCLNECPIGFSPSVNDGLRFLDE